MLLTKIEAFEPKSTPPLQPAPHTEAMESTAVTTGTLESSISALETRLETKFNTMMKPLAAQITAQITNAQVNAQVTEALPNMLAHAERKSSLKDVSGRPSKFSRRMIILDNDEDSSTGTSVRYFRPRELAPELQPPQLFFPRLRMVGHLRVGDPPNPNWLPPP